jgi:nitrite reductase/ring-hydroxylating ferredoxin subunit
MSEFVRGAKKQDISVGEAVVSECNGKPVAIFNVDGEFFAVSNVCPHRGGPLGEGDLEGCVVTCPWHGWQFDVKTGCNTEDEKAKVETYPVRIEGDDVLIKV